MIIENDTQPGKIVTYAVKRTALIPNLLGVNYELVIRDRHWNLANIHFLVSLGCTDGYAQGTLKELAGSCLRYISCDIDRSQKTGYFRTSFWWSISILWHLFGCACVISHELCALPFVLHISRVLDYESLRLLGIFLPWFVISCVIISVLPPSHDKYNAASASDAWFESSLCYRLESQVNLGIGTE